MVGDSYTYVGLSTLRPLFRNGHFVWIQAQNLDYIAQSLVAADTVVIEVVQRYVSSSVIGTKAFRNQVKRALRLTDLPGRIDDRSPVRARMSPTR